MEFTLVDKARMRMYPEDTDTGEAYRWIAIYQSDECLSGVDDADIAHELHISLERQGIPVAGIECQHDFDCCGNWYPDGISILSIDRSYDQVTIQQIFHQNV